MHDSRASVYEKQNRLKDALRDAKKTIDLAPTQWHGYFRSARLFPSLNKSSSALRMCSLAFDRLGDDSKHEGRRRELVALRFPPGSPDEVPSCGDARRPLARLSSMARGGGFTSYALALVAARGIAEESASQGADRAGRFPS